MGAVALIGCGFDHMISVDVNGIGSNRHDHLISATRELELVQNDLKNLPKNLIQIFRKHATRNVLKNQFEEESVELDGDIFDLSFVSDVLGRVFDLIDHGSYSKVYDLGGWILKSNCQSPLWSPLDGCFGWLKNCTESQHNPYTPNMMALEQDFHLFFAVIEKLQFGVGLGFDDGCLGDLAYESGSHEFDVNEYIADASVPFAFREFVKHSPADAIDIAQRFETHRDSVCGIDDISPWNIMHRDGFPVLSDPICDVADGCVMLDNGTSFSWMSQN